MPNATKKLKLDQQGPSEEPRSFDRDSPIPLKNLGNTCYENSIIQCLFSLNMFMDNFEESMAALRQHVKAKTSDALKTDHKIQQDDQQQAQDGDFSFEENDVRWSIAKAFDELYKSYTKKRIQAQTSSKGIEFANNDQDKRDSTSDSNQNENNISIVTPFHSDVAAINNIPTSSSTQNINYTENLFDVQKSCEQTANQATTTIESSQTPSELIIDEPKIPLPSNEDSSPPSSLLPRRSILTPIALMSSNSTTSAIISTNNLAEQSEIEAKLESLKSAVGDRSSQFNSTHQQDASEFFYHVIDSIQEFYQSLDKTIDDDNPVTKAFELELDYLIKCPKCHHKTLTEPEKIRTLPLALPHIVNNETASATIINSNQENSTPSNQSQEAFNHETNGAPTPPTSDLGLDSPESSTYDEQQPQSQDHKETINTSEKENQALTDINVVREDNSSNNSISNNTMLVAKLELTDDAAEHDPISTDISPSSTLPPTPPTPPQQKQYTLNDALNNYFKDELIECNCSQEGCDSKQRTKKCLIRKLPQVLFITLARYSYTGKKNLDEIEAPFELSVPFRENKSPSHSPSAHTKFENNDSNKYQLVAVVSHHGSSLNAGHYTSYVFNQNNSSWYCCDDDSITKVQENEVRSDATKTGYCFFYAHISCINKSKSSAKEILKQESTCTNLENESANLPASESIMVTGNVAADSSVVLTPESSPSPSNKFTQELESDLASENHHTCCLNDDNIDDWS